MERSLGDQYVILDEDSQRVAMLELAAFYDILEVALAESMVGLDFLIQNYLVGGDWVENEDYVLSLHVLDVVEKAASNIAGYIYRAFTLPHNSYYFEGYTVGVRARAVASRQREVFQRLQEWANRGAWPREPGILGEYILGNVNVVEQKGHAGGNYWVSEGGI